MKRYIQVELFQNKNFLNSKELPVLLQTDIKISLEVLTVFMNLFGYTVC